MHIHEQTALAIGWYRREDGIWLNSWGADVPSPAEYPWSLWEGVLLRSFEPSFNNRISGRSNAFRAAYREDMTPEELCALVLRVIKEHPLK